MRVTAMIAAVTVALAACGGEKAETVETPEATPAVETAAAPTTGTTHTVEMIQDGAAFKYVPAELTIKAGDLVVFKSVSGGMHNVQFFSDSLPAGAESVIDAAIVNKLGPLASALVNVGEEISISFAGAPVGSYPYTCLPHMAMGMHGKITVQ